MIVIKCLLKKEIRFPPLGDKLKTSENSFSFFLFFFGGGRGFRCFCSLFYYFFLLLFLFTFFVKMRLVTSEMLIQ